MKKLIIVLALLIFSSPAYSETINPDPHFCPILKKVVETQVKNFVLDCDGVAGLDIEGLAVLEALDVDDHCWRERAASF